jgi:uncharacterized protein YybS (DUF2232 family)
MAKLEVISKFTLALASSVVLFLSGISLPPLGVIAFPFVAQPILLFGLKYGISGGIGVLCVAILLFAVLGTKELALVYGVFAGLAGLLLGLLGRIRAIEYLVVVIATVMLASAGIIALQSYGSWSLMSQDVHGGLTEQVMSAIRMQENMGLSPDSLDLLKTQMPLMIDRIVQLLPALVFLSFAFIALVNILYLLRRFPERRGQWFSLASLREWKAPEQLVWALIACGFILFIPGLSSIRNIAVNLLLVIGAFYFAQGLAVIGFFFAKNKVPRFLRGLTYVLIVFQQIFTLLVVGLGLFDLWGDFRRLRKDKLTSHAS